jgi:RNA polymerase sigma-70 factor (sigma-E family)
MRLSTANDTERVNVADDFARLFDAQFGRMVRLAALLGDDDPEDIAQEAFVRLERRREKLREGDKAAAYLRTTVINLTRSRLRHLRVVRRFAADSPLVESAEVLALLSDDRRQVVQGLSQLSARQRQVVVLRYWLDLSEREIAETLGIRAGAVKSTSSKALASLGQLLGDHDA